ncbi:MAG: hypothetical protein J3Q66DRAFT_347436 [Benniella sp.]|nr:MAG: hypothetical protein J3Q66DRAFT_347436 [Benniella sp.]
MVELVFVTIFMSVSVSVFVLVPFRVCLYCLSVSVRVFSCLLVPARVCQCLSVFDGAQWCPTVPNGACSCLFASAVIEEGSAN